MAEIKRKGSRSIKEIPRNILEGLNNGEIESANLVEFLGVDRKILIENVLIKYNRKKYIKSVLEEVNKLEKHTASTIYKAIGSALYENITINNDKEFLTIISNHTSDIVRCFATFVIGKNAKLNINEMLLKIKPFASDKHFNVRECAWSDVRECIIENLEESILNLSMWAKDEDENIRRFASEVTRPRGVWCKHIEKLKENPELALSILEPLRSDKSKYVRDSVGNWLNDASKTKSEFVKNICKLWGKESDTEETKYIIKKALRTINK